VPHWSAPAAAKAVDPDLLKTFGVRDGSAGPDFLGISNTNFDFTLGSIDSPQQYTATTAGQLAGYVGAGLAIWATPANEETNAYYQNLYYSIALAPIPTPVHATTWMSNPFASWGDSNGTASHKGNVATGAPTVAGLEYDPDILFGANHYTNWQNELPDGSNSQTETYSYLSGGDEPGYEPVFTSNDATNIWAQVYTMGRLAEVAEGVKADDEDKETRYGNDAIAAAVDYEKAIRGNLLYIASQIDFGIAQKKTVAYLYSIDQAGVGYFFTPTAQNMLTGNDTGAPPASAACYAANNGTIGYGYRATLPLVTDTFDSGATFLGGISMQVEDIVKSNPACIVSASSPGALANVDAVIYNATVLTDLSGTTGGRNTSGVGINSSYQVPGFVSNWLTAHGLPATSAVIAGDDFATSSNQGFGLVDTTADGMSPLLYCQRNYTADKNAKAAWAFARVYPALYRDNPDATYAYWVDRVYHVNLADVPAVAQYMLNKSGGVTYSQTTAAFLEACFAAGRQWWEATGSADPYWSQFAHYSGSSRASYYSDDPESEEEVDAVGILAPSVFWWVDTSPPQPPPPPSSNSVSVTRVEQEMDKWCWAASAEMVGKRLYPQTYRTQWDVVFDRAGVTAWHDQLLNRAYGYVYDFLLGVGIDAEWALDEGGTLTDIATGIEHVAHGTVSAGSGAVLSLSSHCAEIDSGQPVVAFVEWAGGGAHAVVVKGYSDANTASPRVTFVDPWYDCGTALFPYYSLTGGGWNIQSGNGAVYTHSVWIAG
jgi:hypothetical protein